MPEEKQRCNWCGGALTERSKFGSRRYGLERRGYAACDSCLDDGSYKMPPDEWISVEHWSAGEDEAPGPSTSLSLGFGMATFLTALVAVEPFTEELDRWEMAAVVGLYLLGAASAFLTPVRPHHYTQAELRRTLWQGVALSVVGLSGLRIIDRLTDSHPGFDLVRSCAFGLLFGWGAVLVVRYVFENRRRLRTQTPGPEPPTH